MFPTQGVQFNTVSKSNKNNLGKSFLFDFEKGEFVIQDGKCKEIEGIESIKIWIIKILKTDQFKYKIYNTGESDEYGIGLKDLVNSDFPQYYIQAEIERLVTQGLKKNPGILNVYNFKFKREKRILVVDFNVNTIHGITSEVIKL
ncbi:DUF2634 domain-containing protein [Clostridium butyricum]|uniref:DUF2634 domain-containing protein n=1 Tax=Clostridium butyricum TaxID=1492 RepID=UPI002ABD41C8|nr:DUF2634 domain-containing protein [Clostridium butyricum]